jgi:hypothetical protein
MPEFKRSRLERKNEEQMTKKTVFLGFLTVFLFILIIVFGLPFLIKFSIFLGNTKNSKDVSTTNVLPPLAPRLVVPFEATNSSQIKIDGFAEAGVIVELLKNDESIGKTDVTSNGDFSFDNIDLSQGDNNFSAVAIKDKTGSSEASKEITVVYDNTPPELTMTNPNQDSVTVDSANISITGKSEKGASVLVNNRVAAVDDDGNFKIELQLNSGDNSVEIIARDAALNETKKDIKVNYDN